MGDPLRIPLSRWAKRRGAWPRLQAAVHAGTGHILVSSEAQEAAAQVVEAALECVDALAVLRLQATVADPVVDVANLSAKAASVSALPPPETITGLIHEARANDSKVFAVVEDADDLDARGLERIRMALECEPDAIERMRIILIGGPRLDLTLAEPAASALSSRISARIQLTRPKRIAIGKREGSGASGIRLAASGFVSAALTSLVGRK
jgi:type II secretory pathway predicted ATPase ExeA